MRSERQDVWVEQLVRGRVIHLPHIAGKSRQPIQQGSTNIGTRLGQGMIGHKANLPHARAQRDGKRHDHQADRRDNPQRAHRSERISNRARIVPEPRPHRRPWRCRTPQTPAAASGPIPVQALSHTVQTMCRSARCRSPAGTRAMRKVTAAAATECPPPCRSRSAARSAARPIRAPRMPHISLPAAPPAKVRVSARPIVGSLAP